MENLTFDKLYDSYNVLSEAKDKISEHTKEFKEAIEGTKGEEREKKLATQIISKFYKHFPSLQEDAINAIIDVCESDNATIRIAGMKALTAFCTESKEVVSRVTFILGQLLQLDDQEYNVASSSLLQILKLYPVNVIRTIFKQIHEENLLVREKCIKFLVTKVKALDKSVLTTEGEDVLITETKNLLHAVTAAEYIDLMPFLISTRLSHTFTGQIELVEIAAEHAQLDQELIPFENGSNNVDRFITCSKFVLPFFSSKVESTKFVVYICDQILPKWDKIEELENGDLYHLTILRQLAELSTNCGKLENASLYAVQIFQKLKDYMPPPPEDSSDIKMPTLDFTVVECLLYAFHRLARQCPDFLTHNPQALKDFRARLTYFSRGAQGCSKAINNLEIKNKNLTEEDERKQKVAPKLLSNINALIRDLFYQPPKYQCNIVLSFKTEEAILKKQQQEKQQQESPPPVVGTRRHIPITFEANGASATSNKQSRNVKTGDGVKLYTPPSGKFSNNFPSYGNRGRGRGRGRRPGRNMGRSWRN